MPQTLALDMKGAGLPQSGADEHALVSVPEKIVNGDRSSDGGVRTELNALQLQMAIGKIVQNRIRQTKIGYAVTHDTADFILAVKYRDAVTIAGENYSDGEAGRTRSDDGNLPPVEWLRAFDHLVGIGGGDIVFNHRKMNRDIFNSADAVTFTLLFVVAYERADRGEWVVFKEHPTGIVQLSGFQQTDHFRDVGMNRAALLAAGLFTAKAAVGFLHYMQCHNDFLRLRVDY